MSIEAVSWALNVPVGGNQKVILLGLSNHAHPNGTESYPDLNTLARYAHCSRTTARDNVRKLEGDGWIVRDGDGPRGQAKWRLAMERTAGVGESDGRDSAASGVAPARPEPSIEPSKGGGGERARDQLDQLPPDVAHLLRRRAKVNGHLVAKEEAMLAAASLAEFNRQAGTDFGLGANHGSIVMRIRERPSWDAPRHIRLVQSAFRFRWWERQGSSRRPTPAVIWGNERCFEQVVQDAVEEARGERTDEGSRFRPRNVE